MSMAALRALLDGDEENFRVASTPGGIEAQEKMGQIAFVANEALPIKCGFGTNRKQIEAMGVVYGEPIDDLFIAVQLPDGWRKAATDHSMWSNLLDDKGRKRASMFYKAAFYDRSAHIGITARYSFGRFPVCGYESPEYDHVTSPIHGAVTDQGQVIWHTEETLTRPVDQNDQRAVLAFYANQDRLSYEAKAWLTENYPDWQDPLAYWD